MIRSFKDVSNLIKQFKWSSLLTRYFKTFFLILILPVSLINIFVYSSLKSNVNKEIESYVKQSSQIVANTVNTSLNSFYNNHILYLDDINVQNYLSADISDVTSVNFFPEISEIRDKMNLHILSSSYLNSIYLYSFKNDYVISNSSGNLKNYFGDIGWLKEYEKHKKNFYIAPQNSPNATHVSVCYELTSHNSTIGILVFNFDLQAFQKTLFSDNETQIISAALYDENKEAIFKIGEPYDKNVSSHKVPSSNEIQIEKKDNYFHSSTPLGHSNFMLCISYMAEGLSNQNNKIALFLLLGFVLCFVISALLSVVLSFKFYESISGIIMQINEDEKENLLQNITNENKFDELSFISQNIAKLTLKHSSLEDELYQTIANLKKMQIITLQSQFNPHFLFNTLNHISILTLGAGEKGELANRIIYNLSALLRISLENKQYVVDAKTEIYYAKKYIEIEQIKHKNKFDVTWDIDDAVNNCTVVKFMLQPIVENAFIHGIYKNINSKNGLLSISAQIINKNVVFQNKDNVKGIDKETLNEIISKLEIDDLPDTKHIGIRNVHQRIKLIFGEEYGITKIQSDSDGTLFEITLPHQLYN